MAKKSLIDQGKAKSLFSKTEQPPAEGEDKVTPKAVGVTASEYKRIQAIAAELGVKPHAVMLYAVRDFMRRWDEGERPKTKTKTVIDF